MLGPDIAVYDIIPVHDDAHARPSTLAYRVRIIIIHTADAHRFLYALAWRNLSPGLISICNEQGGIHALEVDDFTSFAKLHSDAKTNICRVTRAEWIETVAGDSSRHTFVITADRFLRNMVRAVVRTLVDVGRGKLTVDGFRRL